MEICEIVKRIPELEAAAPATREAFAAGAALKQYRKGSHLFFDKDDVRQVYFLVEGTVSLYKLNNTQMKKVIFICGSGAMLNEIVLDDRLASVNCEFLAAGCVLRFDAQQFLRLCEQDFGLAKAVMDSMALKIRRLYHQMKNTSNTVRGDKRIAAKLWKLSRDCGVPCRQGTRIDFDMTITFLADLVGSKRETVSRQLKLLTERNLVIVKKSSFIVPDRGKLLDYFHQA